MYRIRHQPEGRRYVALRDVIAEKAKGVLKMLKSKNPISAFQRFSISGRLLGPPQRLLRSPPGRSPRHHRPQRRRQIHPPENPQPHH
jgi:hypothetical protein